MSAPALAHPFHGADGGLTAGFAHPLFGLDHLLAMAATGLWAAQLGGRAVAPIPSAFVAVMTLGGALGFTGLSLPLVEPMIAASVLALGLLLAMQARLTACGAVLVAGFALFHGIAHGTELPPAISGLTYTVGFVLATASLHAVGILGGLWMRDARLRARLAGVRIALAGVCLLAQAVL